MKRRRHGHQDRKARSGRTRRLLCLLPTSSCLGAFVARITPMDPNDLSRTFRNKQGCEARIKWFPSARTHRTRTEYPAYSERVRTVLGARNRRVHVIGRGQLRISDRGMRIGQTKHESRTTVLRFTLHDSRTTSHEPRFTLPAGRDESVIWKMEKCGMKGTGNREQGTGSSNQ